MYKILQQLQKKENDQLIYFLLPDNTWYQGTIQYVTKDLCVLSPRQDETDKHYYQMIIKVSAIQAIEIGVDPRHKLTDISIKYEENGA